MRCLTLTRKSVSPPLVITFVHGDDESARDRDFSTDWIIMAARFVYTVWVVFLCTFWPE